MDIHLNHEARQAIEAICLLGIFVAAFYFGRRSKS